MQPENGVPHPNIVNTFPKITEKRQGPCPLVY